MLFIDQSDTLRARLASGLFDRIAEWNGYGRALYAWTCGLHAEEPTTSSSSSLDRLSTQAGLMHKAWMLGIPPKVFARPVEQFELADLDRYDVVVAMDSTVRQQILDAVDPAYTGELPLAALNMQQISLLSFWGNFFAYPSWCA